MSQHLPRRLKTLFFCYLQIKFILVYLVIVTPTCAILASTNENDVNTSLDANGNGSRTNGSRLSGFYNNFNNKCYLLTNLYECRCDAAFKELSCKEIGLTYVPTFNRDYTTSIIKLDLSVNNITMILEGEISDLHKLQVLVLKRNQITFISDLAFTNLTSLRILELDDNLLTEFPKALDNLKSLEELSLSGNRIKFIAANAFSNLRNLSLLELKANPLINIENGAFLHLTALKKLILSETKELMRFPQMNGTSSLEILRIDRAGLTSVPDDLCLTCSRLKSLDLKSNKLTKVPVLSNCRNIRVLDLAHNGIDELEATYFSNLSSMHDLLLSHNKIQYIPAHAFFGLKNLQVLDLEGNHITEIHPATFNDTPKLEDLNLGNNFFGDLPTDGLKRLLHLKTFNNPNLKVFPEPHHFPRIQTLVLSYAYHCCTYLPLYTLDDDEVIIETPLTETVFFPKNKKAIDVSLWNSSSLQWRNLTRKFESKQVDDIFKSLATDFPYMANSPSYLDEYNEDNNFMHILTGSDMPSARVVCLPAPGPFLPCTDLFDWWTLRCGVWVVFLLAMLGNGTVVFVLIFSRSKMDVPRFLVCNLAAADFFMGIYLGLLAVVDAATLGEFRMYAIPWQMSFACQVAGFLGVLSSELSVYTLAVITLERNYAITHAMHLNKRLSLKHAGYIMLCGWAFSVIMASMPLFGISDYRKFAVCLPFETTNSSASLIYVVFLMFINGVAFLILMGCYLKMYCAIRGSQAWNSNDSRIAKRMALLVFTDLLCWSPIAFFSLTAVFGWQLISLEGAKVFTVFVLPLNSCCNPFLYAILTKQFKKDCVLICKAIEESRVTRGIGRCRHSSNFSNRQTPANTNSLMDRSSKDGGVVIPEHRPGERNPNPAQICTCNTKLLADSSSGAGNNNVLDDSQEQRLMGVRGGQVGRTGPTRDRSKYYRDHRLGDGTLPTDSRRAWVANKVNRWLMCVRGDVALDGAGHGHGRYARARHLTDQYAYQIAEIQQKQHKRTSSLSSSENFSSSRSDSWRNPHHHHCGVPLRLLDPKHRRASASWLITRKPSQDSNLSSSRNDSSSGSATTASTSTWRMSRSSASGDVRTGTSQHMPEAARSGATTAGPGGARPRLTRQMAIQEDGDPPDTPSRLTVRFLTTIPSAAENSVQMDDDASAALLNNNGSESIAGSQSEGGNPPT